MRCKGSRSGVYIVRAMLHSVCGHRQRSAARKYNRNVYFAACLKSIHPNRLLEVWRFRIVGRGRSTSRCSYCTIPDQKFPSLIPRSGKKLPRQMQRHALLPGDENIRCFLHNCKKSKKLKGRKFRGRRWKSSLYILKVTRWTLLWMWPTAHYRMLDMSAGS